MKKITITVLLSACSIIVYSQLKVTPDGKVGIGITGTPTSRFAVGTTGENHCRNVFHSVSGESVNMKIYGAGNSPYSYGDFGAGLLVVQNVSSTRGDYAIKAVAVKPSPTSSGRAVGVTGLAGNATSGYNWGVIGSLAGNNNGAGLFGAVGYSQGTPINGRYAGYFQGNVKVTGTINSVVVGNSDIRYKQNVREFSRAGDNILSNLVSLNPVSYNYQQVYYEGEYSRDSSQASARTVRQPLFDEKSPMFQKKHFGLVAQEVQRIYPDLVYEDDNGYLTINYIELIPLLIQSMKELKEEVDRIASSSADIRSSTLSEAVSDIPRAVLYQNAPNPFTDRTEIKFALPDNITSAAIFIFNMQGSLIKKAPLNKHQTSLTINGSELNAGMYLYSLIVDEKEIDTKRMILTK